MEIIAHRGSSFSAPENSLAAFEQAIDEGAIRLELDIQTSKDGVPFVCHDVHTGRIADRELTIAHEDAATLDTLVRPNGEHLLRFSTLAEKIAGRVSLDVELKDITLDSARAVLTYLIDFGLHEDALITSFYANPLHIMRSAGYTGRTGLIVGSDSRSIRQRLYEAWPLRTMTDAGVNALVMYHRLAHSALRYALKQRGDALYLWMSMDDERHDEATRARAYRAMSTKDPDGVIVGRVAEAQRVLFDKA